jgi:hypothetical protein
MSSVINKVGRIYETLHLIEDLPQEVTPDMSQSYTIFDQNWNAEKVIN